MHFSIKCHTFTNPKLITQEDLLMKKSVIIRMLLVAIFTLASLSAYGSIYYRYDVEYTTDVYEQPSKKSKVIGRIKKGNNRLQTEYEIIPEYAPTGHEWMKIPFNGGFGYVDGNALYFDSIIKTGEDADNYFVTWKAVSKKLGYYDNYDNFTEEEDDIYRTAAALQAIAVLLMLIAFALVHFIKKGKAGWISALSLLTVASLIIAVQQIYLFHTGFSSVWRYVFDWNGWDTILPIIVALSTYALTYYTLGNINKSKGDEIKWKTGMLISLAGAALLDLDRRLCWYADTEILIGTAVAQLLFCIHIMIRSKSFATSIPTMVAWLIMSFALLHLGFIICGLIGILSGIIACVALLGLLIIFINAAPGTAGLLVDAAGVVIGLLRQRLTGGYVDEKGNKYRDAGRGKVVKEK